MPPRVFAPAILSGLLLWTAFYPLNLGFMAYFAMVPWLTLVRAPGVSARRRYFAAYVGGLAFFLPALQWIRVAQGGVNIRVGPGLSAIQVGEALVFRAGHHEAEDGCGPG